MWSFVKDRETPKKGHKRVDFLGHIRLKILKAPLGNIPGS